jgi:GLEYA domain
MATINYWGLSGIKDSVTVNLTITIDQLIAAIAAEESLPTDYYKISVLNDPTINDTTYGDSSSTLADIGIVDGGTILCTPNQVGTKQDRQIQKLEIAEINRGRTGRPNVYNIDDLPTKYTGNAVTDNANSGGLVEGRPWSNPYSAGIWRDTYTGYFADDPAWFLTATKTGTGIPDLTTITASSIPSTTSIEWRGYFKPTVSDTYTFYTNSDDASYLWIGEIARSGYNTGNALVDNGGLHGATEESGSIALSAGVYYPIRIQAGNNAVTGLCAVSWSNSTQAQTSNFSGLIFYKLVYEGFN